MWVCLKIGYLQYPQIHWFLMVYRFIAVLPHQNCMNFFGVHAPRAPDTSYSIATKNTMLMVMYSVCVYIYNYIYIYILCNSIFNNL